MAIVGVGGRPVVLELNPGLDRSDPLAHRAGARFALLEETRGLPLRVTIDGGPAF